jgi:hypothetical protein
LPFWINAWAFYCHFFLKAISESCGTCICYYISECRSMLDLTIHNLKRTLSDHSTMLLVSDDLKPRDVGIDPSLPCFRHTESKGPPSVTYLHFYDCSKFSVSYYPPSTFYCIAPSKSLLANVSWDISPKAFCALCSLVSSVYPSRLSFLSTTILGWPSLARCSLVPCTSSHMTGLQVAQRMIVIHSRPPQMVSL